MNETPINGEGKQRPCRTFGELDLASSIGERESYRISGLVRLTTGWLRARRLDKKR